MVLMEPAPTPLKSYPKLSAVVLLDPAAKAPIDPAASTLGSVEERTADKSSEKPSTEVVLVRPSVLRLTEVPVRTAPNCIVLLSNEATARR